MFIILLIYVVSLILKDWKVLTFVGKILSIISPLFIGWFIAWMLNPLVKKLTDKGVKKGLSVSSKEFISKLSKEIICEVEGNKRRKN